MSSFSSLTGLFECDHVRAKICGICSEQDAYSLVDIGVGALGINFWSKSKRYCAPDIARPWLKSLKKKIIRVGVFVNEDPAAIQELVDEDIIDLAQLHGDESLEYCHHFVRQAIPFIKAFGVHSAHSLRKVTQYHAEAVLLDAPAPGEYGGTGSVFDWNLAELFVRRHPHLPVFLAGGITPENARSAAESVRPAFIDIATGSESAPGVKDIQKCIAIQQAIVDIPRAFPEHSQDILTPFFDTDPSNSL